MAVIAALDADDFPPLGRVAGTLERNVDRLAATRCKDRVLQTRRRAFGKHFRNMSAHDGREMVVADVEIFHPLGDRRDHLRVAVAETVCAAIEMDVDEPSAVHVPEVIALAAIDDEIDPHALPVGGLAGIPELFRTGDEFVLHLAHRATPDLSCKPQDRRQCPTPS